LTSGDSRARERGWEHLMGLCNFDRNTRFTSNLWNKPWERSFLL
jgi:hypothetical protein